MAYRVRIRKGNKLNKKALKLEKEVEEKIKSKEEFKYSVRDNIYYHFNYPNEAEIRIGKIVKEALELKSNEIIYNDRYMLNPLEIDIWIPSKRLAIEFQGKHHYTDKDQKMRDQLKFNICQEIGIIFIEIPFWYKNTQVRYKLKSISEKYHLKEFNIVTREMIKSKTFKRSVSHHNKFKKYQSDTEFNKTKWQKFLKTMNY